MVDNSTREQQPTISAAVPPPPPALVRRNHSIDTATTQQRKPMRRRSSLFDSLPAKSRGASTLSFQAVIPETRQSPPLSMTRFSGNSTLLAEDLTSRNMPPVATAEDEDDDVSMSSSFSPQKKRPRGSLFGAVMEKLGGSSSSKAQQMPPPGTPQKEESTSKLPGFLSPSGKSIMNIVNKFVMHSPFRFQSPPKKRRLLSREEEDASNQSSYSFNKPPQQSKLVSTPSPNHKRAAMNEDSMSSLHDDANWREAPLHNGQAEIMDWTIRQAWQLECHPPEKITAIVNSRLVRRALEYWHYQDSGIVSNDDFDPSSGRRPDETFGKKKDFNKKQSLSEKVLQGATMTKGKGVGTALSETTASKFDPIKKVDNNNIKDPAEELAGRLIKSVKAKATTTGGSKKTGLGQHTNTDYHDTQTSSEPRIRAWQQAFRSLYMQWCGRIIEETAQENITTALLLDCYFYGVAEDHVVLFRVDAASHKHGYVPRVLLSASEDSFLQDLRGLVGIENIAVLKDPIQEWLATKQQQKDEELRQKQALPMSPTVKADLEALRKAQAYGEVAGADVSIKIKAKKNDPANTQDSPKQQQGITVVGYDNVAAFFEVYFNRLGQVMNCDHQSRRRLPQLFCPRELGPFMHGSLKSLQVRPVKVANEKSNEKSSSPSMVTGTVEIQATVILPSIIRRLVALSASTLIQLHSVTSAEGISPDTSAPLAIRSPSREVDGVHHQAGSHYFVLHASDDNKAGEHTRIEQPLTIKQGGVEQASLLFNGIRQQKAPKEEMPQLDSRLENDKKELHEFQTGKSLQLVVWDISRSNVAACKVGSII